MVARKIFYPRAITFGRIFASLPQNHTPNHAYEWVHHLHPERLPVFLVGEKNDNGMFTVYERSRGVQYFRVSQLDPRTGGIIKESSGKDCYEFFGRGETIGEIKQICEAIKF